MIQALHQFIRYSLGMALLLGIQACSEPGLPEGSHVKLIDLDGTKNFRDIGGYSTWQKQTIKYGAVYRSDQFSELSEEDLEQFSELGIKTIIDLRSNQERASKPNRLPENHNYQVINLSISLSGLQPEELSKQLRAGDLDYDTAKDQMINGYQEVVTHHSPLIRVILETLADENNLPAVIHCTAGKDRTGVAISAVMLALGVSPDDVIEDYLLTNDLVLPTYASARVMLKTVSGFKTDDKTFDAVAGVDADYLKASMEVMKQGRDSFGGYFLGNLGLDQKVIEQLRNNLLKSTALENESP